METKVAPFEVSSPLELSEALARHEAKDQSFASVRVFGPHVLTRPFKFPAISRRDLRSGLSMEASEILSVPARDIVVAYHLTSEGAEGVAGICVAMPRKELLEYLACFKESALIPVGLTSSAAAGMVDFLKDHPLIGADHCVVNFLRPNMAGIAVFADGAPALFCEAYDLSDEDLQEKVMNSVRYVCSRSASKRMGKVFFTGQVQGKENLIGKLKGLEDHVQAQLPLDVPLVAGWKAPDLFGSYVLGYEQSTSLLRILKMITLGCVICAVLLGIRIFNSQVQLHKVGSAVKMSDYRTALELKEQLRRLTHEK